MIGKAHAVFSEGDGCVSGSPLATLVLLLPLPVVYLLAGMPAPLQFLEGLYARGWQPIYLHLWFVAHLLLYCFAYTALRQISGLFEDAPRKVPLASYAALASFIVALALITWLVRTLYPIDRWVPFLLIVS